jgi:hypothetical protein
MLMQRDCDVRGSIAPSAIADSARLIGGVLTLLGGMTKGGRKKAAPNEIHGKAGQLGPHFAIHGFARLAGA